MHTQTSIFPPNSKRNIRVHTQAQAQEASAVASSRQVLLQEMDIMRAEMQKLESELVSLIVVSFVFVCTE